MYKVDELEFNSLYAATGYVALSYEYNNKEELIDLCENIISEGNY